MDPHKFRIQPFDVPRASQLEWQALNAFLNCMAAESLPDDLPVPVEATISSWSNVPPVVERYVWTALDPETSAIAGLAWTSYINMEENKHITQCYIGVLPEHRRQGIAKSFLGLLARHAAEKERRLMAGETSDRVPAGGEFMTWAGAKAALANRVNQLVLADVDRGMLAAWRERAQERASRFDLGLWIGPYPEEDLQAIADVKRAMNDAPTGDLEVEDMQWTPEILRQVDESMQKSGIERWCFYVRERATGSLAGYTEMMWRLARPYVVQQGDTAVLPQYRGLGLGRWLKAVMIEKVLADRPEARFIRTVNADTNEHMLKINTEMGFKQYRADIFWQVETAAVLERLLG
jgi:mycothiol synthase